jgi:hypothetical protein
MRAAIFVFGPVLILLRKFVPSSGALAELPLKALGPTGVRIVVVPI